MAETRGKGISKREAAKSELTKAKQRENRAYGPGHPLHPTKIAAIGAPPGKRMQDVAEKHKKNFPDLVKSIRDDRKKTFKKVKPKPSSRKFNTTKQKPKGPRKTSPMEKERVVDTMKSKFKGIIGDFKTAGEMKAATKGLDTLTSKGPGKLKLALRGGGRAYGRNS
jgi:hypothetical protein